MSISLSQKQLKSLTLAKMAPVSAATRRAKTPTRTRSRSRSKSKGKGKRVVNPEVRSAQARRDHTMKALSKLKPLMDRKLDHEKKLALAKSGYFVVSKDSKNDGKDAEELKNLQAAYDNLVKEIQLAVGAVRAGLGDRPIRLRLTCEFALTATVTSGIVNTVTMGSSSTGRIRPDLDAQEWSSCAALFDEFKVLGGHVSFTYLNGNNSAAATTQVQTNSGAGDATPTIGYDVDSTAIGGSTAMCQLSQHKQFGNLVNCQGSTATGTYAPLHQFHYHIPRGTALDLGNSVVPGTEWQSVAGAEAVGFIKFYHQGLIVSAVKVGGGVHYYDCEFRCRA